ncbi:efflux RND transporter periplasmic adaptor subunit [Algicella marina]|uniref:efflux RND transporter periplasmic adaptor subunit n=1 Tax=Algicella marina TaxID=2683284 RepID=UPI00137B336B|nr:efflux RND transporter periplasmic adaptor subunit [Algicella marina]
MIRRLAAILVFLPLSALAEDAAEVSQVPRPVVTEIVSLTAATGNDYVGTVASRTGTDLGFPLAGRLAERPAGAADRVEAGDVLARLDPETLDADVRAAEAGVTVAQAQYRSAEDAEARARELAARGVDSETRLEDAGRALVAAEARLEQAQATLARAEDMRSLAILRAAENGVITEVYAEPGAALAAGQAVLRLAGTDEREVVIDLTEQDVATLEVGTRFDALLAVDPRIAANAILSRIDPVAERATRTRRLHLTLVDPSDAFRLGALVRVRPQADSEATSTLPLAALVDPDGSPSVWKVDRSDSTVVRTPVTLGEAFGSRVRILQGIAPGDEVVIKGIHSLSDGQHVGRRIEP